MWFLLQITAENDQNTSFRAPIGAASVKAVKAAIRAAKSVDANAKYPELASALAYTIKAIVADDFGSDDPTELEIEYGLVDWRWDPRLQGGVSAALPADFAPVDLSALRTERNVWTPVTGIYADYEDLLSNWSDEPTDLHQVVVLDGWC